MPTSTLVAPHPGGPGDRLITLAELAQLVGLKTSATKALVRRAGFPPAVRLSQRTPRWWYSEVVGWLEGQRSAYQPAPCAGLRPRRPRRSHHGER